MEWESSKPSTGKAEGQAEEQAEGQAEGQAEKHRGQEDDKHCPSSEPLQLCSCMDLQLCMDGAQQLRHILKPAAC